MSTTPNIPYRLEFSVEVPGTPEQVWQAIATAKGMSDWFLPTEMEEREGGSLHFTMGPEMGSDGQVTDWDPPRRIVYQEDWAALMGKDPDELSPLTSHFPGQEATQLEVTASHAGNAETLWSTLHDALELGEEGATVQVRGATGTVERVGERQTLV